MGGVQFSMKTFLNWITGSILLGSLFLPKVWSAEYSDRLDSDTPVLHQRTQFWIWINTELSTQEGVIFDSRYSDKIFERLDFRGVGAAERRSRILKARNYWRSFLIQLDQAVDQGKKLNDEQKRVFGLYSDLPDPHKFLAASQRRRVRFQPGQKEVTERARINAKRWFSGVERVLVSKELPKELAYIPYVESSYDTSVTSKVGASGIWQIMPSAGRPFLRINPGRDERNYPLIATRAAAELLSANHDALGDWSLAVTAYNHGRQALLRAQARTGADRWEELQALYRSRSFGFASSNFYPSFKAQLEKGSSNQ
jgi:membrane-bound lytic murein transglycosylase D